MPYRKPDPALPKLGARLALTRRALDLTRFQMAQLLGTDMPTWGTYEDGLVRIRPMKPSSSPPMASRWIGFTMAEGDEPAPAHPHQNPPARKTMRRWSEKKPAIGRGCGRCVRDMTKRRVPDEAMSESGEGRGAGRGQKKAPRWGGAKLPSAR